MKHSGGAKNQRSPKKFNPDERHTDSFEIEEDFALIFPEFIWAVRDFHLELKDDDGNDITPNEYLEESLGILH